MSPFPHAHAKSLKSIPPFFTLHCGQVRRYVLMLALLDAGELVESAEVLDLPEVRVGNPRDNVLSGMLPTPDEINETIGSWTFRLSHLISECTMDALVTTHSPSPVVQSACDASFANERRRAMLPYKRTLRRGGAWATREP